MSGNVTTVAFENVFCLEMHQNNNKLFLIIFNINTTKRYENT